MEQEPLQQAEAWAIETFGAAELGDPRRTDRLIKVASALAENPSASLPHASQTWGETQGAYRFLSDPAFTYEDILLPHWSPRLPRSGPRFAYAAAGRHDRV
jgi:hypothetical protein